MQTKKELVFALAGNLTVVKLLFLIILQEPDNMLVTGLE